MWVGAEITVGTKGNVHVSWALEPLSLRSGLAPAPASCVTLGRSLGISVPALAKLVVRMRRDHPHGASGVVLGEQTASS